MSNRNKWIAIGIIIMLVAVGAIWYAARKRNPTAHNASSEQTNGKEANTTPNAAIATSTSAAPSVNLGAAAKGTAAYTAAVEKYQYRIQFSQCHGVNNITGAGTLAIRQGDKIMLDNRDGTAHTFAWKGGSVRIAGYGYAIETVSVLGQYPITCDGGGAEQLNVQP